MYDLLSYLFNGIPDFSLLQLPIELLTVLVFILGIVIVRCLVDIILLFVRWLLHVR